MNHTTAITHQKAYRQGLQAAGEDWSLQRLFPNSNDKLAVGDDDYALLFQVVFPLYTTFAFIANNRLLPRTLNYQLAQANGEVLTPDEIFEALQIPLPHIAERLLMTIDCGPATSTELKAALADGNKGRFVGLLQDCDCHLLPISYLCRLLWTPITFPEGLSFEEFHDYANSVLTADHDERLGTEAMMFNRSIEDWDNEDDADQYESVDNAGRSYCENLFIYLMGLYWDEPSLFSTTERKQIEVIATRPVAAELYARAEEYHQLAQRGQEFTLPPDYFSLKNESTHPDEHFALRYEVVMAGPAKLAELINHLADCGYISPTPAVKRMLAYRLSGKMRPARLVPIEWTGRNGKSYELIYLIKTLSERADYRKMRRFFCGCQWVKDRDSSYANGAAYDFKAFLQRLYPTHAAHRQILL